MKTDYRPDIEGLRGIAILMVVLSHAGVPGFEGGLSGVDVFFVISGFLITGQLRGELAQSSRIDFSAFYARRVRRLLPAFSLMMLCTIAFVIGESGADKKLQVWSSICAALWSANIYFSLADFGYFESSARDSLFLHTWSLGVEEQFYLVWPLLLALVWNSFRANSARALKLGMVLIATGGFAVGLVATWRWPVAAYYQMPFRLWELALGGLCGAITLKEDRAIATTARYAGMFGLILLVVACMVISDHVSYPGFWVLLPVLGAVLLIGAGTLDRPSWATLLLGSPALRFFGRVSYSWYLWHWPALVGLRHLGYTDPAARLAAILGSLLAAIITFRFVELPIKRLRIADSRNVLLFGILASIMIATIAFRWGAPKLNANAQLGAQTTADRIRATISLPQIYSVPGCDEWYFRDRLVPCISKPSKTAQHTVVILGDSFGLQWFPALQQLFIEADWNVVVLTKSSCPIVDEPVFYERIHRYFTECDVWRREAIAYVQQTRPDIVVVGSSGSYGFTSDQWIEGSKRVFTQLLEGAPHVVVIAPTPRLPFDGPGCVIAHSEIIGQTQPTDVCAAALATSEDKIAIDALNLAVSQIAGAAIVNLNTEICPNSRCVAWSAGMLVYRESGHLNARYVQRLTPVLAAKLAPFLEGATHAEP